MNIEKKHIFTIIVMTIFIIFIFLSSWIAWLAYSLFMLTFYSVIAYWVYLAWKKIKKKESKKYTKFLPIFYHYFARLFILLAISLIWLVYYANEINPFKIPTYHITNGEKEIVFQWMMHIWRDKYYKDVIEKIEKYKEDWYVLYYESVKEAKNPENYEKFDKAMWFKFTPDLYDNIAKLYGLNFQWDYNFLWIVNKKDYNVDISFDKIIEEYEKLPNKKQPPISEVMDINKAAIESLAEMNDTQLFLLRKVMHAIMNVMISNESISDWIRNNVANGDMFKIILDKRNEHVVDYINSHNHNKIFITYWELHFDWIFELLKQSDPNWKITKIDYLYPISDKGE